MFSYTAESLYHALMSPYVMHNASSDPNTTHIDWGVEAAVVGRRCRLFLPPLLQHLILGAVFRKASHISALVL